MMSARWYREQKISDYNKALNWDVDHVQVNGEAFSQSELENIEIHEDSVVKVFYQAKNTDYIGEASFYDYEVILMTQPDSRGGSEYQCRFQLSV